MFFMEISINIDPNIMSVEELKDYFEAQQNFNESICSFEIIKAQSIVRTIDPTVLVACVSAIGTALGALIGGLLKVAQMASTRKIVIQGRDGTRIEIPADTQDDRIDEIVRRAKDLDIQRIQLSC
jgi:hypothetical protein